jgi:hypothetical protein
LSKGKSEKCKLELFSNWYQNSIPETTIDLMKIDVQGAEYDVISGGLDVITKDVKAITVEMQYLDFYENSKPFYELMKLLYENDFFIFSFFENNKKSNLQILENNALFLNKRFYEYPHTK